MRVVIKVSGNPGPITAARIAAFKAKADAAVQWAALNCEGLAKQRCRVKTGRLRSSIHTVKTGNNSCQCGTTVEYARPVEFGHKTRNDKSFVGPSPFLRPAFAQARSECLAELKALKV